jgi:hypothetical protein
VGRLLRNRWAPLVAIAVLTVAIGFEISAVADSGSTDPRAPRASARVARDFAVALSSYDHERIEADVERILSFGDDAFDATVRDDLGKDFVEGVKRNKGVSVGTVLHGPTEQRVAGGRAAFLVVVAQRIVSEGDTEEPPQARTQSMLVTVTTGDAPRVVAVELL